MPDDMQPDPAPASSNAPIPFTDTAAAIMGGLQPPGPPMDVAQSGPGTTTIPDVGDTALPERQYQQHMGALHQILDRVGSILGGDETLHVTKDQQGNVSVTKDPSTSGEKWGRVAAAALGGAATGLANSVGPNALARAGAAGFQQGAQMPQQKQQEMNQQATAEQKLMMNNANNAMLHQKVIQSALASHAAEVKIAGDDAALMNAYHDEISDGADDFGKITSEDDIHKLAQDPRFQEALKAHTNGTMKTVVVPGADGKAEVHLLATDQSDANTPVGEGKGYMRPEFDDKGRVNLKRVEVSPSTKKGDLDTLQQKGISDFLSAKTKESINDKNEAAANAVQPNIDLKKQAEDLKKQGETEKERHDRAMEGIANKRASATAAPSAGGLTSPYDANDPNDVIAGKLADGEQLQKDVFSRMTAPMKAYLISRAENISQQRYGVGYDEPTIQRESNFANAPKTQAYFGATRALLGGTSDVPKGVLDNMIDAAHAAGLGDDPVKNAAILKMADHPLAAEFFNHDKLAAVRGFIAARNEAERNVTTAAGNPLISGSDSDKKLQRMEQTLTEGTPTLSAMKSAADQVKQSATAERNSYIENNRFLRRKYAGAPAGRDVTPPPGGGGQQAPVAAPLADRLNAALTGR